MMFSAMLILLPLSFLTTQNLRSNRYRPLLQLLFWFFVFNFLFLMWLGGRPIASPYIEQGQLATIFYFGYFIILIFIG